MVSAGTSRPKLSSEKRNRYWPVLALKPTKPCNWSAASQIWLDVILMANLASYGFACKANGSVYRRSLTPEPITLRCRGSRKPWQGGQHLLAKQWGQVIGQGQSGIEPAQLFQLGGGLNLMGQYGADRYRPASRYRLRWQRGR